MNDVEDRKLSYKHFRWLTGGLVTRRSSPPRQHDGRTPCTIKLGRPSSTNTMSKRPREQLCIFVLDHYSDTTPKSAEEARLTPEIYQSDPMVESNNVLAVDTRRLGFWLTFSVQFSSSRAMQAYGV